MRTICLFVLAVASASAHSDPISDLNDKGLAASEQRQFDAAEKLFLEAIERWQALGPKYEAHIAVVKTNLAQVYAGQGNRVKCVATLEEALASLRRTLGMRNIRSIITLNLLAGTHMMMGNYARAQALFEEALPIERELFPHDHELARTLAGLATVAMQENRPAEGMPLAEEGLTLALKADGENSLDAALAYANVAEGRRLLGERDRAEPLFRKARVIYERLLGPDNPRVASVLTQEGLMMLLDNKLGRAEETLTRALAIVEKSCPACAYERVAAENNLAMVRIRQGRYDEAERLLSGILALNDKGEKIPAGEISVALQALAVVRQKEKRYEEAERLKRRAELLTTALH